MATHAIEHSRSYSNLNPALTNLLAGGGAGIMEACVCHPLDTVKVTMQLLRKQSVHPESRQGFLQTFVRIIRTEGARGLYKGFDAVVIGMGPKMAVRFTSFEAYKHLFTSTTGELSGTATFLSGLAAGITEAVCVVNPMEVVKIRLQGQHFSPVMAGGIPVPKYRNVFHATSSVAWNEGVGALYRGVTLTALRQGTNQAANFTVYTKLREALLEGRSEGESLPSYQTATIGLVSGAMGPFFNAPIDTIKTRLQSSKRVRGESALRSVYGIITSTKRNEGVAAFYKGLTPRIIRVAPGQAVTFTVYGLLKKQLQD